MLTRLMKPILKQVGYELTRIPKNRKESLGYALYSYLKKDGSFDYERYRRIQEEGNKRKLHSVWVVEENIAYLARYIRSVIPSPRFGICHGTRRGKEQEWFRKYLDCEVIGTEISDTAETFPHTIQWDFHEVKPEWLNAVDFIYTNSFDHSYAPEKCLDAWISCLRPRGVCIIEHSPRHGAETANELDPFGADVFLMPYLITTWGSGKYGVRQLISAPTENGKDGRSHFVVVQRWGSMDQSGEVQYQTAQATDELLRAG